MSDNKEDDGRLPVFMGRIKDAYVSFSYKINENGVCQVDQNRVRKMNTQNLDFYMDFMHFFKYINNQHDVRVIVMTSSAKHFCAGIDFNFVSEIMTTNQDKDAARNGLDFDQKAKYQQKAFLAVEHCRFPVLAGVDGLCIGAGVDLVSSFDIVYCTKNSEYSVREIDLAFVADLGTLNRIPASTKSIMLFKEQALTGDTFGSKEAFEMGMVARVFDDVLQMDKALFALANKIAEKSPVTIVGIKKTIDFIKRENIKKTLDYVKTLNMSLGLNEDVQQAIMSLISKEKTQFPKL